MSCQSLQQRAQYDHQAMNCPSFSSDITAYVSSPDSYASFESAFSESDQMANFQNKMRKDNPIYSPSDNIPPHDPFSQEGMKMEAATINADIKKMREQFKPEQMLRNIAENERKYPMSVCQSNIQFPLTRMQHYNSEKLGTTLLEGFDQLGAKESTGMSLFKLILLLILIGALIYGAYYLCTNSGEEDITMSQNLFGSTKPATMSDEIKKLLNNIN